MEKIDWDKIPEGFDWAATDENGELWAFKYEPEDGFCSWFVGDDKDQIRISGPVAGGYKGGSWRESLQHRPTKILRNNGGNAEIREIQFGPRPEKLWVGMKGKNRNGEVFTLIQIGNSAEIREYYRLNWGDGVQTDTEGRFWPIGELHMDIIEWEQPIVTCCDPEPEPDDWKAKYADLYLTHMEKVDECTTLRERCDELKHALEHALEQTEIELRSMYGYREKLNKIVNLLNEA